MTGANVVEVSEKDGQWVVYVAHAGCWKIVRSREDALVCAKLWSETYGGKIEERMVKT